MSDKPSEYPNGDGSVFAEEAALDSILDEAKGSAAADDGAQDAASSETIADTAAEDGAADAVQALLAQARAELAEEQKRYAELNDRFQRSAADFQNTLRRREKQTSESIARASEQIVLKLLPVLDDFDRAFENLPESVVSEHAPWVEGFQQIQKKLTQVLQDEGVSAIPLDGAFDPTLHEAVTSEPSDAVESGHIIATLRTGYQQRGKVIRPALVRVAA